MGRTVGKIDMPKMKEFCIDKLGFKIATENKQDDEHWWTGIKLPGDSFVITLSTFYQGEKPKPMTFYLIAENIEAAHSDLEAKGVELTVIANDLYGPGSGVKWFSATDPEGNVWVVGEGMAEWM